MSIQDPDTLKSYFTLAKVQTPSNYNDLIDTIFARNLIGNPIAEHINVTSSSIQFKDGDDVYTELAGGTLSIGLITQDHAFVSRSGFQVKNGNVVKFDAQSDGDLFIGSNIANPGNTYFSIFSEEQLYNYELIGAGDMLIGDNSANKANILWDKSSGKLLFRGGTTTQVEIDTTGALSAGDGGVIIDLEGIKLNAASGVYGTGSINWWNGTQRELSMGLLTNLGNPVASYLDSHYGLEIIINTPNEACLVFFDGTSTTSKFRVSNGDGWISDDVRIGDGLYVGDSSLNTNPGAGEIIATVKMYINDTENSKSTIGITINQGTATDEGISLKNSNVAHGITTTTETDTYGFFAPVNDDGGMRIRGLTEVTDALNLYGALTTEITGTKATNATAAVSITAGVKSGTSLTGLSADSNILRITSHGSVKFIFDSDGDMWYTGNLQPYRNSATYSGYVFVPLITPITNSDWDGDDSKTTGTYTIDLSGWDSSLTGVKAVLIRLVGEVATANSGYYMAPRPYGGSNDVVRMIPQVNARQTEITAIVPTDSTNNDIDIVVVGSTFTTVRLEIWGYWI